MNLVVTGADGFIGRHVVTRALSAGHTVLQWGHKNGPASDAPKTGRLAVALDSPEAPGLLEGADAVMHLAGCYPLFGSELPSLATFLHTNTVLTTALLHACEQAGVPRFVLASTGAVYGQCPESIVAESTVPNGRSPYAASKRAAELMLEAQVGSSGLSGTSLRLFNVYGPGQSASNVCATIASQAVEGGPVRIFSDTPIRDFIYVGDVADALLAAVSVESDLPPAMNIGSGQGVSVRTLAELVMATAGNTSELQVTHPSAADSDKQVADITLAGAALGWYPATPLQTGIAAVVKEQQARASAQRRKQQ